MASLARAFQSHKVSFLVFMKTAIKHRTDFSSNGELSPLHLQHSSVHPVHQTCTRRTVFALWQALTVTDRCKVSRATQQNMAESLTRLVGQAM